MRPICLALLGTLLLPSCGLFKKKKKAVLRSPNIRLSGRVHSVNKDAGFVLIRRYGPWKVGEGQVVESRGEGRTASLLPTGEKLGEHVAADIRSGEVEAGDAVYIRQVAKQPKKPTPAKPAAADSAHRSGSPAKTSQKTPEPGPKTPEKSKNLTPPEDQL